MEWKSKVQGFIVLLKIECSSYYVCEDSTGFIYCFTIIACKYNGDFN